MNVPRRITGRGCSASCNETRYRASEDCVALALLTGLLDAALRVWDQDRVTAKSHIAMATAMLRGALTCASEQCSGSPKGGLAPWQARKVRDFIDASLESKIRVKDCAKQARLSASYFSAAFRVTFGKTVARYIRDRRIGCAQRLMLASQMPLSQVAAAAGFSDQAHYSRVFRDMIGVSPRAWRRKNMTLTPAQQEPVLWRIVQFSSADGAADAAKRLAPGTGAQSEVAGSAEGAVGTDPQQSL
jgi:AraC family transcriptional regulator